MQNTPNVTQIDPALPPKRPVRPLPLLYELLAGMVGLCLSFTAILMMDHFDETLRTSQKVQDVLGVPILAQISQTPSAAANHSHTPPAVAARDNSALLNSFGSLRINVNRLMSQQSVKVLLITSPSRGDGKTTIASNLAAAFVRSGKTVALLDADLYHPQVHARLKLDNQRGLTDILENGLAWEKAAQNSGRMIVIPGGAPSSSSSILLESDAMTKLLADLQRKADVVIIDGPPLFLMDAQILATQAGGIILVVRQGDTITGVARAMLDQLNFIDANIFGAVLNCVPQKQSYYFDSRIEDLSAKGSAPLDRSKASVQQEAGPQKESGKWNETGTSV